MTGLLFDPPCFKSGREIPAYYYPILKEIKEHKGNVALTSTETKKAIFLSFREYAKTSKDEQRIAFTLQSDVDSVQKITKHSISYRLRRLAPMSINRITDDVQIMLYTLGQKEGLTTRSKDVSNVVLGTILSVLGIIFAIFAVAVMKIIGIIIVLSIIALIALVWFFMTDNRSTLPPSQRQRTKYVVSLTELGEETLKNLEAYAKFFKGTTSDSEYGLKPYSEKAWEYATNKISIEADLT